ncbi:hypothetical protein TWF225_002326 [Orbilia oligospora]|uniref:Uncharacterized protein n=1 Tax=Orbilia oligospora TaxID=2813651 RepID=A0A7C8JYW4_ORBOL|nr:hypothetical protein TWF751_002635 [Orbilia oligospora]KAF3163062.1 hypothetical protein TWF225_002326 [Orbilia oligospora]KAF3251924.1 hypothetical protein TWF217_007908 [Orbilia oligospora]KAF3257020.1 hypothetical protein TWF128_005157 [Orbilia oligospora]TGJ62798.1 hypothetical protein EYR41_011979 [Orbilia oligospora]
MESTNLTESSLPLYKRGSRTSSVGSRKTLLSHSRTISSQDQITPPPTPKDGPSREGTPKETSSKRVSSQEESAVSVTSNGESSMDVSLPDTRPKSHTSASSKTSSKRISRPTEYPAFMRAFYHFRPFQNADTATVTIALSPGDMIMVHNIHENGWADGTALASGSRGWLPTNFCAAYEVEEMQPLLRASIAVFEECRVASNASFVTASQTVVGDVVNGVRYLLEVTDCLTRDSENVQTDESIRKTRKVLLSELSVLVKTARRLPDELDGEELTSQAQDLIDDMILSSFRVVVRGAKFLDAWCEIHDPLPEDLGEDEMATINEDDCDHTSEVRTEAGNRDSIQTSLTTALDPLPAKERPQRLTIITPSYQPSTETSFLALTPASTVKESDSESEIMEAKPEPVAQTALATARLNYTYDSLLSCLATYIGTIHLKAPLPSRLFVLTKDAVEVGKELLHVVDLIQERGEADESLELSKTNFKEEMNVLVTEAQRLVKPLSEQEDEEPLAGNESQPLIDAATKCVQGATLCFDNAHGVLEKMEDFEIALTSAPEPAVSQIGIGITTTVPTAPVVDGLHSPTTTTTTSSSPSSSPSSSSLSSSSSEASSPVITKLNLDKNLPSLPTIMSPVTVEPSLATPVPSPPPKDVKVIIEEKHQSIDSTVATSVSMQREDSQQSATSEEDKFSTRATTPIHEESETPLATPVPKPTTTVIIPTSETSHSDSTPPTPVDAPAIPKTHAHNLVTKDGLVYIGSVAALVEQMTMPDSKPDIIFVTTFFTTFRCWSSPIEITNVLIDRFDEVDQNLLGSTPVRVRVYNVFKTWLETHWKKESDMEALPIIRDFAINKLKPVLVTPGDRLQELTDKVLHVASDTSLVPREPATLQKTRSAVALNQAAGFAEPRITSRQYATLRAFQANGGEVPSVLEFDPHEIARQLTVIDQKIWCQITPHELLGKEWTKKEDSRAVNVLAMTKLSTQMALWIAFTILNDPDPKKRAAVIKHWIKIADKLFEMANFNTMMAIICALNNSTIGRLKKTWELVSPKTKAALEKLRSIVDPSRNYFELRSRTRNQLAPCLPFLGLYLTDMVFFVDGNADKRPLPDEDPKNPTGVNFFKYTQMTKLLQEIQNFQHPYPIQEVPEFQHWLEYQMRTLNESGYGDVQKLYRQSLAIEPKRRDPPSAPTLTVSTSDPTPVSNPVVATPVTAPENRGLLGWTSSILKDKSSIASFNLAMSNP